MDEKLEKYFCKFFLNLYFHFPWFHLFKIEELQNSLNETVKELRKLEDSIPGGLETLTKSRVSMISSNLINSQKVLSILKDKVRQYKRSLYAQSIEEKKK